MCRKNQLLPILFLPLFLVSISGSLIAQSTTPKNSFDSTYYYIATTLAAQDIEKAISDAALLLHTSEDSLQKIKSLMLLATLNERTGKHTDALNFAIQGESLAEKVGNKQWQIRISGFLSTTFRELGLIAEGKKYIEAAEKANNGSTNSSPIITTSIHQEKAYYEIDDKNYRNALTEAQQAINVLENIPADKRNSASTIMATSYQIAGFCYMKLDSIEKANEYLTSALKILEKQESELKGYIYQNLGELALKQKEYKAAIGYLTQALNYTVTSDNFNLKVTTYKSLSDYYLATGHSDSAIGFQSKYGELLEVHSSLTKRVSNGLIEKFDDELNKKTTKSYILYGVCIGLLLVISVFIIYLIQLRKKYLEFIEKFRTQKIATLESQTETVSSVSEDDTSVNKNEDLTIEEDNQIAVAPDAMLQAPVLDNIQLPCDANKKEGLSIPKETEERILNGLLKLEKEKFYLKNDVTLSFLSASLKTNQKYLSIVINKNKDKDFSNYINDLRINYIINELQEKPEYLKYKIAYLAQKSGFSTHSKFTTAFTSITGISPSAFINNLKKDTQRKP